jgi:uncharacterized protein
MPISPGAIRVPGTRSIFRAVALVLVGLTAAASGIGGHAARLVLGDGDLLDLLWTAVGVAGLGLVVIEFVSALRGKRLRWKLVAAAVILLLLQFYVFPVVLASLAVNADRFDVAPASSLGIPGARDVAFRTGDGVTLHGWYVPGRRAAAVALAHGSHGSREAVEAHLRLLARLGYGVLSFDARGHGESGGEPNALGWLGDRDVDAAVRFLRGRAGVDASRVGVVGVSMGAEEALRAASISRGVRAIVADGAGASTTGDARATGASGVELVVNWLGMRATEALSGDREPPSLTSQVHAIRAHVLLIASNAPGELEIDRELARRIGERAALWHVDADHAQGLKRHAAAYRARLSAFLGAQL